jgi:hypothetical protein
MPVDGSSVMRHLIEKAEEIELDFDAVVLELAKLPLHEFDRVRKSEAKRLDVRLHVLENAVKRARAAASGDGHVAASQRDQVIEIGLGYELWVDPDQFAYATIEVDDHREHYALASVAFKRHLLSDYGKKFRSESRGRSFPTAPSDQAYREGWNAIEAVAGEGPIHKPAVRIGGTGNSVYLDLGGSDWSAIKITAEDWRLVDPEQVRFIRPGGMRTIPSPRFNKGISRLREFANVKNNDDFILLALWMVGALRPTGPYPILILGGEQGSAKTTLAKLIRTLIDPNKVELSSPPATRADLVLAAKNGLVVAFDNVSHLKPEMCDDLCRLATGAGLRTRRLYTDDEEYLVSVCRPILLNGIPELAVRPDFAERCIVITLPHIPKDRRRTEKAFWAAFEEARPDILAALLGAVSVALENHRAVERRLPDLPRMADFACWAGAAAPAFGWSCDDFLDAYDGNQATVNEKAMEADPVAVAVRDLALDERDWRGTVTGLLKILNKNVAEELQHHRAWPRAPNQLSNRLRRAAPGLRRLGIRIDLDARHPRTRVKEIYISAEE